MISLDALYAKNEKKYPVYVSKNNSNGEKQTILLMIPNGGRMTLYCSKKISALLTEIKSKLDGDFYCWNRLHSFTTIVSKKHAKITIFVVVRCLLNILRY